MCTLNEAGRKSICAGVCELRPIREGQGLGKRSKLRANRLVVANTATGRKKRDMGMLRITITETLSEQRWTLEGRLVQPWISELKSTWTKTETARRERKCVVDLTGVTFIDKSGEKARNSSRPVLTPDTSCTTSRRKSRIVGYKERSTS